MAARRNKPFAGRAVSPGLVAQPFLMLPEQLLGPCRKLLRFPDAFAQRPLARFDPGDVVVEFLAGQRTRFGLNADQVRIVSFSSGTGWKCGKASGEIRLMH